MEAFDSRSDRVQGGIVGKGAVDGAGAGVDEHRADPFTATEQGVVDGLRQPAQQRLGAAGEFAGAGPDQGGQGGVDAVLAIGELIREGSAHSSVSASKSSS